MTNELLLLSGNDIPFEEAQLILHPPTLKEIAYIGEEALWSGVEFLNFSKNLLSNEDKVVLSSKSDFEVLMTIIQDKNATIRMHKTQIEMVLTLLFPNYHVIFTPSSIGFQLENETNLLLIDNNNFEAFKAIVREVFCLDQLMGGSASSGYNPVNAAAKMLAKKFKDRQKKLSQLKHDNEGGGSFNILSIYVSILAVGVGHDLNTLMNYTVFQLIDEFRRYQLKMEFDINMQARMAGARDLKEVENWMKNIHSK